MANKTYVVKKNGEIIKELKSLSAAKKIAQAENAEVYCGDELVYPNQGETDNQTEAPNTVETQIDDGEEKQIDEGAGEQIDDVEMKYRLKALMNVRVSPSLSSRKIATLLPGTIVSVDKISNDWLHLTNGSFIFYGNGKYAEKVQ